MPAGTASCESLGDTLCACNDTARQEAVRGSSHLGFEDVGTVKLKGFEEPVRLCRAAPR